MINRLLGGIIQGKLDTGKAIIILGSRQTGKTSLLKSIFEGKEGVLFMNGDDVDIRNLFENINAARLKAIIGNHRYVIVDEAQSLERGVLLTVLSRIGQGSRVVLTHDVAQRDNLRVGRHDGVVAVVESLKGHPLFAHITLTRSERSQIAALVTEMLEEPINFNS